MPSGENIWNKLLRDNRRMRKGDLGKLQRKLWFCIEAAETGLRGAMQEDNGEEIRRWLHVTSQLAAVSAYSPTQEVYVTLPNATNHGISVNFRLYGCLQDGIGTATVDGYVVRLQKVDAAADTLRIERMTNAAFTILATHSLEMLNGHKLGLQILNTGVINVWADVGSGWVQQFTTTDTNHSCTSTRIGVGIINANVHVDDFGGGTQVVDGGGGANNSLLAVPMTYE